MRLTILTTLCAEGVAAVTAAIEPGDVRVITPRPLSPQNQGDVELVITAQIRAHISGDPTLSNNAHNVEIATDQGVVVLKGPVDSVAEKAAIEAKARQVEGVKEVASELEVSR